MIGECCSNSLWTRTFSYHSIKVVRHTLYPVYSIFKEVKSFKHPWRKLSSKVCLWPDGAKELKGFQAEGNLTNAY